jgi:fumarylpyruvate hydrolase
MNVEYAVGVPPVTSVPVAGSKLQFPVRRIYCVGRNYAAHAREYGHDEKLPPFFFAKAADMIVQNGGTMPYPSLTKDLHHEVELVAAIAKGGTNISGENALEHVYGYGIGLDMTRRDIQQAASKSGKPWEIGKSFDYSAPCSEIHTVKEVGHITSGKIEITVNGQVRQSSDINLMIWDVAHIIEHLSKQVALVPGDLIFTGTPEGVGPVVTGDTLVGRIDKLGELTIKIG